MNVGQIQRLLSPLARRMRMLVSRAVVNVVYDGMKMQGLQLSLLADETADQVERFQEYGFTSHPHAGAEAIAVAVGGARGHLVTIAVDDRRYRLASLAAGEVALYDDLSQKVHLTRSGIVVDGAGKPVHFTNVPDTYMDGNLHVAGQGTFAGDVTAEGTSVHAHRHGGVQPGSGDSGGPV